MKIFADLKQRAAVAFLAALIYSILLMRWYQQSRHLPDPIPAPVIIEVKGHVEHPGIHLLSGTSATVADALEAAGGPECGSPKGIPAEICQRPLHTGQSLQITALNRNNPQLRIEPMAAAARLALGGKLDVNRAAEADLQLVPQMKCEFAAAIVARRAIKPWHGLQELQEIPGVGPKTVEKWRQYLEIENVR